MTLRQRPVPVYKRGWFWIMAGWLAGAAIRFSVGL